MFWNLGKPSRYELGANCDTAGLPGSAVILEIGSIPALDEAGEVEPGGMGGAVVL